MESDPGFQAALAEARAGLAEGGIPIGGCLVGGDGTILGQGRNMRMQKGSPTLHVSIRADWLWETKNFQLIHRSRKSCIWKDTANYIALGRDFHIGERWKTACSDV